MTAAALDDGRAFNGAISQDDRRRSAPRPDLAPVDGRGLPERLAFAARYGALIRFHDLTDTEDGDWSVFFTADPVIAAARLASLDLAAIEARLDQVLAALRKARGARARHDHARQATRSLGRLIRALDSAPAGRKDFDSVLARVIQADRRNLFAGALRDLAAHLSEHALDEGPGGRDPPPAGRRLSEAAFQRFLDLIETAIGGLLAQLANDMSEARRTVETAGTTGANGRRAPQAALWHAFVEVAGHAQCAVNTFPARMIAFYHQEVLRQTETPLLPDRVLLCLTAAPGVPAVAVPRGTLFTAGTDAAGASIQYAADTALTVGAATVSALRILRLAPGDPPGAGQAAQDPARVLSATVALSGAPPSVVVPFQPFGADRPGDDGGLTTQAATLGFAVASPTLLMAGGQRQVTLSLGLSPASLAAVTPRLQAIGKSAGGLEPAAVLARILRAAFTLDHSTAGGWLPVFDWSVSPPESDGGGGVYRLAFALPPSAGPLAGLSATPPAKGAVPPAPGEAVPDRDQPTLRARLIQDPVTLGQGGAKARVHPYALLRDLVLENLRLEVVVDGLGDLGLATPAGPANASRPFAPFGSPPAQNAALLIDAPELFAKTPGRLSLDLTWSGLPATGAGFQGHYAGYVVDADGSSVLARTLFDNTSFIGALDVAAPGMWTLPAPSPGAAPLYLFRTDPASPTPDPGAPLMARAVLTAPTPLPQPVPPYHDPGQSRLRLTLAGPAQAFGHALYAPNVMAAALQDSAAAAACAQMCARRQGGAKPAAAGAVTHLQSAHVANAQTPDDLYPRVLPGLVNAAVGGLTAAAVETIKAGVTASGARADTRAAWMRSLKVAETDPAPRPPAGPPRLALPNLTLPGLGPPRSDPRIVAQLSAWVTQNAAAMGAGALGDLNQARALLAAAAGLVQAQGAVAGQPTARARAAMTTAIQAAQATVSAVAETTIRQCIQGCLGGQAAGGLPNPAWLPMLSALSLGYEAAAALPGAADGTRFFHLAPFDGIEAAPWPVGAAVPLLAAISHRGVLEIGLSAPAPALTLLVGLRPGAGERPADAPSPRWEQAAEGGWRPLTPTGDTTRGLRDTGIVSLAFGPWPAAGGPWLRLVIDKDAGDPPMLTALAANALTATWVGPGGAATRGVPTPAGAITRPAAPLAGLALVGQPFASTGGAPRAVGQAFQVWMGERLRHKGFGVQPADLARLVLAAFASLWQVGVAPAVDPTGAPAPGHVWVVVVPGPGSAGVTDSAAPYADGALLAAISAWLRPRLSPFARLAVTNPPYQRVTVTAEALFSDDDAASAWASRLNADLIAWLSPWPDPDLPPRPAHYDTRHGIAEFIRRRPYVLALLSLSLDREPEVTPGGWRYVTSAPAHRLTGRTASRGAGR